jgi:hypothetical protein
MPSRGALPAVGDVLMSERSARADVYEIRLVSAEGHVTARRYAEAVEMVRELARQLKSDGWFTNDQTHYASIASYRSQRRDG